MTLPIPLPTPFLKNHIGNRTDFTISLSYSKICQEEMGRWPLPPRRGDGRQRKTHVTCVQKAATQSAMHTDRDAPTVRGWARLTPGSLSHCEHLWKSERGEHRDTTTRPCQQALKPETKMNMPSVQNKTAEEPRNSSQVEKSELKLKIWIKLSRCK